jgi:gamma-glutamylcyclotransferase (GGCT)/AIG2-like uncharacterized protein YtfP
MNEQLVFVYGTLRRAGAGSMTIRFPTARFVADADVSGSLYDLGTYPGLQLGETDALVTGEIYEIDDEVLTQLDDFEASSNYLRKRVEISVGPETKWCWVYEPDPEYYSLSTLITSGDWLEYVRTRQKTDNTKTVG